MFLAIMKSQMNKTEYYLDIVSEYILFVMQVHTIIFIDGGIISGTDHNVSASN